MAAPAERAAQRQSLLIALGDNGCGAQYRSAALAGQQGGFFDRLFGNNGGIFSAPSNAPMGGTFRTICVRTCDGFYYPISYATSPDRFRDDEQTCQRMCPASEVSLYTYHNPGEEVAQAVSLNGRPYSELADGVQLSQGADASLQLPQTGRKLGRRAQDQRPGRYDCPRRCGGHRAERQAAVATAHRRRWQTDPSRSARQHGCSRNG